MEAANIWGPAFFFLMAVADLLLVVVYVKLKERRRDRSSGRGTDDRAGRGTDGDGCNVPAGTRK